MPAMQTEEGFLRFVAAVPQERDEGQTLAATSVGTTAVCWSVLDFG